MKFNVKKPFILAGFGLMLWACTKEPLADPVAEKDTDAIKKSTLAVAEEVGMAVNIKEVYYNGTTGDYEVSFYGSSTNYTVSVQSFQPDLKIELSIAQGSVTSDVILDVTGETLSIENDQVYDFVELDSYRLGSTSPQLLGVSLCIIAHHLENPQTSLSLIDNGSADYVPDSPVPGCFWCNDVVGYGPCNFNFQFEIVQPRRFWIKWGNTQLGDPVPC